MPYLVETPGYSGPATAGRYLPPGRYRIGEINDWPNGQITPSVANEMLEIGWASKIEIEPDEAEPAEGKAKSTKKGKGSSGEPAPTATDQDQSEQLAARDEDSVG